MSTVCMGRFSLDDAEGYLANLWLRLERDNVETPTLSCEFHADGAVTLWLDQPKREAAGSNLARVAD